MDGDMKLTPEQARFVVTEAIRTFFIDVRVVGQGPAEENFRQEMREVTPTLPKVVRKETSLYFADLHRMSGFRAILALEQRLVGAE